MHDKYHNIKKVLNKYLKENNLSKVACLTNYSPNEYDKKYLIEDFNYICFCVSDFTEQSRTLFLKYCKGYKRISFNVVISSIEQSLLDRQFGYVFIKCKSKDEVEQKIHYISVNKQKINRNYPILLRMICEADNIGCLSLPENIKIEDELSANDLMLQVK